MAAMVAAFCKHSLLISPPCLTLYRARHVPPLGRTTTLQTSPLFTCTSGRSTCNAWRPICNLTLHIDVTLYYILRRSFSPDRRTLSW